MKTISEKFRVLVKTDSYTGNFEREMCAHMTGHIGECEVGQEFVGQEVFNVFDNYVEDVPDDNGCRRPVEVSDMNTNDFWIFFSQQPTREQLELMDSLARTFVTKSKEITRYPAELNFLGLEVYNITTTFEKL